MNKLLSLVLIIMMFCPAAIAEPQTIDLEAMSYEELAEHIKQTQLAMWNTDGWQEVEVPMGIYEIGVDIPAGKWTMAASKYTGLTYGESVNEYNTGVEDRIESESLNEGESLTWNFVEGTFLEIRYAAVVFTPYAGANLGFK